MTALSITPPLVCPQIFWFLVKHLIPENSVFTSDSGWDLEEPGRDNEKFDKMISTIVKPPTPDPGSPFSLEDLPLEIGITRQFQFSSSLARMSVIVRKLGSKNFTIYTKVHRYVGVQIYNLSSPTLEQ